MGAVFSILPQLPFSALQRDADNCIKVYFRDMGYTALFAAKGENAEQFVLYKSLENGFAKDLLCAGEVDMRFMGFAYVRNYDKRCVNG